MSTLYIATDGAATNNGKANCKASYGFCIVNSVDLDTIWSILNNVCKEKKASSIDELISHGDIDCHESYAILPAHADAAATNNRAELMAFLKALERVEEEDLSGDIVWISDSEYSQKSVDEWSRKWILTPSKLTNKANLDLILPIQKKIDKLRIDRKVTLIHVNSHIKQPTAPKEFKNLAGDPWLLWFLNHRVDMQCAEVIGK